jgi:hypothetical protein
MFNNSRRFNVTGSSVKSVPTRVGRTSSAVRSRTQEQAYMGGVGFPLGIGGGGANLSLTASGPMTNVSMLAGMVSQQEDQLRKYYRDIYFYDAVGGSACDMVSSFPYSDFSLTGIEPERIEKYMESMVRLNIRQLMPEVTLAYLVDGAYCSSLLFNKKDKVFIDLINYQIDDCNIEELPFFGTDPIITVKTNEALRRFIQSNNKQATTLRKMLPRELLQVMSGPAFELDPLTTLYVARKTIPGAEPISWLKRILPAYLIEKTLFRGTLVETMRRQRSMLHIAMGDDTHEFTPDEMAETVNQFQMADLDPLGAIVGTRNNVNAQEIRQGGDFWKWTDNIDILVPHKLRALGISEAFLSGDSNYSNVETGMSVFMENMDSQRNYMTYQVLTNKVFPIVAVANDFFKDGKEVKTNTRDKVNFQLSNHNDLDIPVVRWHKQLEARAEENMMETLSALGEKGFPIPLRMWAAAAKIDINALYEDLREDEKIKAKLAKITGKKIDFDPAAGMENFDAGGDDSGFGDGGEYASMRNLTRNLRKVPLLARQFSDNASDIKGQTKTGRAKYIMNQRKAKAEHDRLIVQATKVLSNDPNVRRKALQRVKAKVGHIPSFNLR